MGSVKTFINKLIKPEWFYRSGQIKVQKYGSGFFMSYDAANSTEWQSDAVQMLNDFVEVPEVNAVVNYKAKAWSAMNIRAIDKKTGEDYTGGDKIAYLFENPNWFQSSKEFLRQTKIFRELFGNEYNYLNVPFGFDVSNTNSIFTLPPYMVEYELSKDTPNFYTVSDAKGLVTYYYVIEVNGQRYRYQLENAWLNHMNDNRVNYLDGQMLNGVSSLQAATINIRNIRAAYEARNVLINNRGALGIISRQATNNDLGSLPADEKEKERIQEALRTYGLKNTKNQWIVSNLALKWDAITQNVDELKLFDEVKDDMVKICEVLNVPPELFLTETTFDNKKQADKQLYQNTIIPEANEWISSQNAMFENNKRTWEWVADFSHIPALQEDRQSEAQTFNTAMSGIKTAIELGLMTIEEAKKEMQEYL